MLSRLTTIDRDDIVATSVIVCGELMYMAEKSARKSENLLTIRSFLETITIIDINRKIFDTYGSLKAQIFDRFAPKDKKQRRKYKLENIGFGENDLWIAATVIAYNAILVSSDSDFSRIQNVINFSSECWVK